MPYTEMRSFIIEGMIPEIKATILHKDNHNFDALEQNAINIEKGLKDSGRLDYIDRGDQERRLVNAEDNVKTLTETMNKLLEEFRETNSNIRDIKHESRRPRKDREFDRYGRRIVDRSQDLAHEKNIQTIHAIRPVIIIEAFLESVITITNVETLTKNKITTMTKKNVKVETTVEALLLIDAIVAEKAMVLIIIVEITAKTETKAKNENQRINRQKPIKELNLTLRDV